MTHFVRFLFAALLAVVPCFFSCNGNGGSHDGGGATYVPGGGSGSSGGGTTGNLTESFTTEDLWNLSNAGNAYRIVELLSTNQAMEQTQTIVLQAAAIGLPAGGTATLTISGGIAFSGTVQAAADGTVTFVIPAIPNGITITVALSVANSSGTVLYSGSCQETLSDDWLDINLHLYRRFWTLPAGISLTASPDGFVYDNTRLSEMTTLTIAGLEDAPAGAAISYAWELDASPLSDSGSFITRSWNELIGPTAPTGELTKTFTVTVSYTDIAGEAKTASASTDVIIGPPVTIPAFSIKVNPPTSYDTANSNASQYALMNNSDPFTFEVELPAGTEFPTGTVLSWSITKVGSGGGTVTAIGPSVSKTPAELGVTTTAGTWRVNCTATNSRAAAPVPATEKMMQSRILALPSFIIQQNTPTNHNANNSSGDTYAFLPGAGGKYNLTAAVTSGTEVDGMKYSWTISGSTFSYESTTSSTCEVAVSALPGFDSKTYASPGSWTVTCELTYPGLTPVSNTTTLSGFVLVMPDIKITDSTSLSSGTKDGTKAYFWNTGGDSFSFKVESATSGVPIPEGTSYSWTIGIWSDSGSIPAAGTHSVSPQIADVFGISPADTNSFTVSCTISMSGLSPDKNASTGLYAIKSGSIRLAKPVFTIEAVAGVSVSGDTITILPGYDRSSAKIRFNFTSVQPIDGITYSVSNGTLTGAIGEASLTSGISLSVANFKSGTYTYTCSASYGLTPGAFLASEVSNPMTITVTGP